MSERDENFEKKVFVRNSNWLWSVDGRQANFLPPPRVFKKRSKMKTWHKVFLLPEISAWGWFCCKKVTGLLFQDVFSDITARRYYKKSLPVSIASAITFAHHLLPQTNNNQAGGIDHRSNLVDSYYCILFYIFYFKFFFICSSTSFLSPLDGSYLL